MKKVVCFIFLLAFCFNLGAQKINTALVYVVKKPEKITNKTPVLIMLHGYGSNESDLFGLSKSLDSHLLVFSLRAPNAISGGGFAWYKMEFLPDQKFKYAYEETTLSRQKILSFISDACKSYGVDSSQVYLLGFSQGAIMAYDIAISSPKKIKGIMALSGKMLEETKLAKIDWLSVGQISFFIGHGSSDNIIKISDAEKANEFLKSKKISHLSFMTYLAPHTITTQELNDIKIWLAKSIDSKLHSQN